MATLGRAHPAAADAEPRWFALHWVRLPGAESCIDGVTLARRVEQQAGRKLFVAPDRANRWVEGAVQRRDVGYRAELQLFAGDGVSLGSRQVGSAAPDCDALSERVALVLAIMIDASERPPDEAPALAEPAPETPLAQPEAPDQAEPAAAAPDEPDRYHLLALARMAWGVLPETALGLGVALSLRIGSWGGLRVEGGAFLEQTEPVDEARQAQVTLQLAHAGLAYCPLWQGWGRIGLTGCAGVDVGAIRSRSDGLRTDTHDRTRAFVQVQAGVGVGLRIVGPVSMQVRGALLVPVFSPSYHVVQDGASREVFSLSRLIPALDLGLGADF